MKQSDLCWKIRKLDTQPEVSPNSNQRRDLRRMKHDMQELMIIQCQRCRLILHRSFLPTKGMRHEGNFVNQPIFALGRVSIRSAKDQVFIFCGKCSAKIASIASSKLIKMQLQAVTMQVPQGRLFQNNQSEYKREPYDLLGAFSGLSCRNIMQEIYRLAYTKMWRYKLLTRTLGESFKREQKKFKGLYNLILLNENGKGRNSKTDSKVEYDRAMRSTTIQHSHSHNPSKSLDKPRDSSLPH